MRVLLAVAVLMLLALSTVPARAEYGDLDCSTHFVFPRFTWKLPADANAPMRWWGGQRGKMHQGATVPARCRPKKAEPKRP